MLELAKKYAALHGAAILAHRIKGKEITFVLSSGPKLTMTESQLQLAISNVEKLQAGTVADGEPTPPPALDGTAPSADKPKSKRKEK